ncbi:MAG: response regulator transcription factor [Anaerolineales bacterium]|nr:response regulator transcription factor [Anaerolineales bacterium]
MNPPAISLLLVDDDVSITGQVGAFLTRAGYRVQTEADGARALEQIQALDPDLVILDVLLPGMDGRAVLRALRAGGDRRPVILLTKVGKASERALALEEGADDYLNKPFSARELLARIRAVLRRAHDAPVPLTSAWKLTAGNLILDRRARRAVLNGQTIAMKPKTLALLEYLMTHPDELMTRERLLNAVWGWEYPAGQRTVDTRVAELRRALGDDAGQPAFIETAPSEGYRFIAPVQGEK